MDPTAIEEYLRSILLQWTVIIGAAQVFGRLARRCAQPLAVGEILAGVLLGPSALGLIWPADWPTLFPTETQPSLQLLGKLGIILLLFQVGMEFDYGHLKSRSRTVIAVSVLGIAAPFLGGLLIGPWLHREFASHIPYLGFQLFVCIALSISALPIMGRILLEMNLQRTAVGALAISAAAIDDVVGWILLAVATALVASGFDWLTLSYQVVGVVSLFFVLKRFVGPWLRRPWRQDWQARDGAGMSASYLALLLMVLFACCLMTNLLGVFAIFGAFLLGVALHEERSLVKAWRDQFMALVLVALVPIFFTNTGLHTEIGALKTPVAWLGFSLVMLMAIAGKLGGCYLGARYTGQPRRESACVAALMNTRALMGLVAINVGLDLGLLTRELFTMFVLMALLTTAMTEPLLRWWLPRELRAN
ncbi:MAG: cation:proton antiporter, partial [Gammaproteobacteria bacterium]